MSGASLLGYVNADHWGIAMPLGQEFRVVEAAIEVVDEALRTRRP